MPLTRTINAICRVDKFPRKQCIGDGFEALHNHTDNLKRITSTEMKWYQF